MASGFRRNDGADFDDLFDPDVIGNGPSVGGFRRNDGSALRYAHIQYGTKGPNVGMRNSDGTDVSNYWAAKGTAVYWLAANGKTYTANNQSRGSGRVSMIIRANGTWEVRIVNVNSGTDSLVESGTWLPSGESASNWSVQLSTSLSNSGVVNGGTNAQSTTAANPTACTSDNTAYIESKAALTQDRASTNGDIVCRLYKNGSLRSTTTIYAYCNVNGN